MKTIITCSLALAALAGTPAAYAADAEEERFETRIVGDKSNVVIDRSKAYLLVEAPNAVAVTFFRIPTPEQRARDLAKRNEALAEAHAEWVEDHARWTRRIANFKRSATMPDPPLEPIEPTEANFPWDAIEKRTMVTVGPLNRFSKGEDASLYLQEVPPGEYAYYGSITLGLGVCTCMGTVKFDVAPGKVTSLRYDFAYMDPRGHLLDTDRKPPEGVELNDAIARLAMILSEDAPNARDPRLPADMLTRAAFRAMPTIPNWFGTEINRLQPIPGVLAYERDRVIDLKAGGATSGAGTP